jgi:hypothetical protein
MTREHSGGPTKVINLYECKCPGRPYDDPSTCPGDCPDVGRYRNIVPSNQARNFMPLSSVTVFDFVPPSVLVSSMCHVALPLSNYAFLCMSVELL